MNIRDNILSIKKQIPQAITIVAATKTRSIEEIEEAIGAGIEFIGENYVQEAEKKFYLLKSKVRFHCLGHLQSNKIKKAVEIFDMIQSLDSIKSAIEIDKRCSNIKKIMPVLIEVNIGGESSKTGVSPEDAVKLINEISVLKYLKVKGIMTMAPYSTEIEKYRTFYRKTKGLFERIKSLKIRNIDMEILSMGMSSSYKIAIEEGATMIRLGTAIFGKIR